MGTTSCRSIPWTANGCDPFWGFGTVPAAVTFVYSNPGGAPDGTEFYQELNQSGALFLRTIHNGGSGGAVDYIPLNGPYGAEAIGGFNVRITGPAGFDRTYVWTVGQAPSVCQPPGVYGPPAAETCTVTIPLGHGPQPNLNLTTRDRLESEGCTLGMARYSLHSKAASLNVQDTPLSYSPPRGPPIDFTVTYNQRENQQPATFTFSNLGPKWSFNWLSYVTDHPTAQLGKTAVAVMGGGSEMFAFNFSNGSFNPDSQSHAVTHSHRCEPL